MVTRIYPYVNTLITSHPMEVSLELCNRLSVLLQEANFLDRNTRRQKRVEKIKTVVGFIEENSMMPSESKMIELFEKTNDEILESEAPLEAFITKEIVPLMLQSESTGVGWKYLFDETINQMEGNTPTHTVSTMITQMMEHIIKMIDENM